MRKALLFLMLLLLSVTGLVPSANAESVADNAIQPRYDSYYLYGVFNIPVDAQCSVIIYYTNSNGAVRSVKFDCPLGSGGGDFNPNPYPYRFDGDAWNPAASVRVVAHSNTPNAVGTYRWYSPPVGTYATGEFVWDDMLGLAVANLAEYSNFQEFYSNCSSWRLNVNAGVTPVPTPVPTPTSYEYEAPFPTCYPVSGEGAIEGPSLPGDSSITVIMPFVNTFWDIIGPSNVVTIFILIIAVGLMILLLSG